MAVSLGHLSGFETTANAINDGGQVTGEALPFSSQYHELFYDGTMHDIGALGGGFSNGWAINNSGQITGEYTSGGGMVDLNTLIDPQLGWSLGIGRGINDAGQITGYGYVGPDQLLHAFLRTPVPEPASAMLILISATSPLRRGRRGKLRPRPPRAPSYSCLGIRTRALLWRKKFPN